MAVAPSRPGTDAQRPKVLGQPNGNPPILVGATGMYLSMSKGQQAWVTGTGVQFGVEHGSLVVIDQRLPYKTPELIVLDGPPPGFDAMLNRIEPGPVAEPDEPGPVAEVAEVAEVEVEVEVGPDPETMSVRDVLAHIADHPDDADRILALEQAGRQRATIIRALS